MERKRVTFFITLFWFALTNLMLSQSDADPGSFKFDVPQHIKNLNDQIRLAENNEDWESYFQLREKMVQAWSQENPEVAKLYRTVNAGNPDLTLDGTTANQQGKIKTNKNLLFEIPAQSKVLWGNDMMITGGRAYDISMDISRDDDIYIAVLGRLDGTATKDSVYIYKSEDGGLTWNSWSSVYAASLGIDKVEIMCFDGFPGSGGDSYILLFALLDNGWLRVGRSETTTPGWGFYTVTGTAAGGPVSDFAVDRNYTSSNYRAICLYDSSGASGTWIKSIRSEPGSYGSVWQDAVSLGILGEDLDLCYGTGGVTYASFNGFNTGNLYVFENSNAGDPVSWGSSITLVEGSSDTTRHVEIISSRDGAPNNIAVALFERKNGLTYDLHYVTKPAGNNTWGTMQNWVIPEENKWPALYSRKVNGNQAFQGVFMRSAEGNLAPRSIRYKSYTGSSWTGSTQVSDSANDVTGLQKPEAGELDGGIGVYGFAGANYTGVYFDNSSWNLTDVNDGSGDFPEIFILKQNYPNPFNPSTVIEYILPEENFVTLKVYNLIGEEIAVLVNENKTAGVYKVNFDAADLTSGVYIYRITAGNHTITHKMMLIK